MSTTPANPDAVSAGPDAPASAIACVDRGRELRLENRLEEALACFEAALRLDPAYARAHAGYAATLGKMGLHRRAIESYWEALRLGPDNAGVYTGLGNRYLAQGRADLAADCYRRAAALAPEDGAAHLDLLFTLNFDHRRTPEEIFREHRAYGARHGAPFGAPSHAPHVPRDGQRPLRIGYVSGDFYRHAVASFFEPVLANHSRDAFDIVLYSNTLEEDAVTERFRRLAGAGQWRTVTRASDDEMAQMVREDGIDILVDLSGHTAENRLGVFMRKPAPVQATYLGYPNTTGIPAIDYRLTDAWADPPGLADSLHTEKLVRLPRGFLCFGRPEDAPEVAPAPFRRSGAIAFGSCSKSLKWNAEVIRVWAAILRRTPDSRLLLHHCTAVRDGLRTRLAEEFFAQGVAPDRIEILGSTGWERHWSWFHQVDLALDPFPYNGTSGTCETLWMGVPVIALAGRTHVSRVSVSLLSVLKLESLIAATPEDYVETAVRLAAGPTELARLRAGMRERMLHSPLMDGPGFTRALEDAYRWMWEEGPVSLRQSARPVPPAVHAAASAL